jgi:hypothetical protein
MNFNIVVTFKDKVHLNSVKNKLEDIVNVIAKELCENSLINVSQIEEKITKKYPEYRKYCTTDVANCEDDKILFNATRIRRIIDQLKDDRDFKRLCAFKKNVVDGTDRKVPIGSVIYSANALPYSIQRIPIMRPSIRVGRMSVIVPNYFPITPYNMSMLGGATEDIPDGCIGKMIDGDSITNVKLVDFSEFEKQYKDMLKGTDSKYGTQHERITKAYNTLQRLQRIDDTNLTPADMIDELELLANYLKMYIVPIDTYVKYEAIKAGE